LRWVDIQRIESDSDIKIKLMSRKIVCFGEMLWDVFPEHKIVGGAPLNVALRLHTLGNKVQMISRIGEDPMGEDLVNYLVDNGLSTEFIQRDAIHSTGEVKVNLNEKGSASYEILSPRAWDAIDVSVKDLELVSESDVFIFGSLAARNKSTRGSLEMLLKQASYKVFDVNLRSPFYSTELLASLMQHADFIKFNDEELFEIATELGCTSISLEQNIMFIAHRFGCSQLCVTKGKHGAVLFYKGEMHYSSGFHVTVVDTVGAGDSFLATLITYLPSHSPKEALDYACAMGALVASRKGANPDISIAMLESMVGKDKQFQ